MPNGVSRLAPHIPRAIIMALFIAPAIALVAIGLQYSGATASHVFNNLFDDYVRGSIKLLLIALVVALPIGVISGYLIARYDFIGKKFLSVGLLLPLAIPSYIMGYSVIGFFESHTDNFSVQTYPHVAVGVLFGVNLYPYLYVLCKSSFSQQPQEYEEISRLHGNSSSFSFFAITLPIAWPAVIIGCALIGMEVLADFGLSKIFGLTTFTTGIFRVWNNMNEVGTATLLAIILVLCELTLIIIEKRQRARLKYYQTGITGRKSPRVLRGSKNIFAFLFCCLPIVVGFLLPVYQLAAWSLTLEDFTGMGELASLTFNSIFLSAAAAFLMIVIGGMVVSLFKNRTLITYGYALPGIVVAIAISGIASIIDKTAFFSWLRSWPFFTSFLFSGSLIMLFYAYHIRFISLSVQSLESSLALIKPSMVEQLSLHRIGRLTRLRNFYLPVLKQPILFTSLILFIEVIKELPATLMLRPLDFNTLAVRVYELINDERLIEAAPLSLTLILCSLLPVFLLGFAVQEKRYVS